MNGYRLRLSRRAFRELARLRRSVIAYNRVRDAIAELAEDPRPRQSKQLRARTGQRSRRVGDYRIVYTVDDDARLVTVIGVGHRKDVYR